MSTQLPQKIHFVGIGGIGMSGLAEFLNKEGHTITGSDLEKSDLTQKLEKRGININYSHKKENIKNTEMIVYSSAIPHDNPEIQTEQVPVIKRAEMLNRIMQKRKYSIAISGMHGKTTVSSLLTHIFETAGLDPCALIGGILQDKETNIRYGAGDVCIVEGDEYDQSFLSLYPSDIIVTNIEAEHLDCYESFEHIKSSFKKFASRIGPSGNLIVNYDNKNIRDVFSDFDNKITFGFNAKADYSVVDYIIKPEHTEFIVQHKNNEWVFEISLPGKHNIINALACITMSFCYDISPDSIKKGLKTFPGIERRMEIRYRDNNYTLIDDYAHHPTEIKATLSSTNQKFNGRLIAVFQPHLYSRTKEFYQDFAEVLTAADTSYVTEIYPAREEPIPEVSSKLITEQNRFLNFCSKNKIVDELLNIIQPGDIIITLGAGDINQIHEELIKKID